MSLKALVWWGGVLCAACSQLNVNANKPGQTPAPPPQPTGAPEPAPAQGPWIEVTPPPGGPPTSFVLKRAAQAVSHKTTSMGMGLAGIADWSTQFPFLDLMKSARNWQNASSLSLDARGWVKSLAPGQVAEQFFVTLHGSEGPIPYTRFVVTYKGKGRVSYHLNAQKDEAASVPGRDVITLNNSTDGYGLLKITETDPSDYIRDIAIVPESEMAKFEAGEIFNPLWLDKVKDFRAVRFMDWMGTNGSKQQKWANRPVFEDRSWASGTPIEVMLSLANTINADPWFNMPHLADEEYMEKFAQHVKAGLAPQLKVYVEHSNEVWNWGFEQAQYANTTGRARWGDVGNAYMQWHGMRTATMCDVWKRVFAEEKGRVVCVLGIQTGYRGLQTGALECPKWVAEQPGREPCYKHGIDAIGVTGYFSGGINGHDATQQNAVRPWFSLPDGGVEKAHEQLKDGRHFSNDDTVASYADHFAYWKGVADEYGLAMVAYEGGSHVTANGQPVQDDAAFINFHVAVNRAEGMRDRYLEMFNLWKEKGGSLFMHFVDVGRPGKWGSWGALEYLGQAPTPKWRAITEFNKQSCWWSGCAY